MHRDNRASYWTELELIGHSFKLNVIYWAVYFLLGRASGVAADIVIVIADEVVFCIVEWVMLAVN